MRWEGTNSPLTPWYKFLGITVNQGKVPVSIDFDLNNVKYTTEDLGERKYSLTLGSNGADKSVEIITLGGQDSNEAAIFGFSALTLDEGSNTIQFHFRLLLPVRHLSLLLSYL